MCKKKNHNKVSTISVSENVLKVPRVYFMLKNKKCSENGDYFRHHTAHEDELLV